ncbi:PTS fructose transporter subunit IIA [Streptococcus bovimastitidis]|uniref:PTS fructose transporter subunit IIA n=1 Tax=Streptococcus bovimastitidis TaxID=1856638 RepID=A0A1L8MQL6_9STRE|nr:PTS sugar transporter subunit IIA [Streptococcus bovimastitidis]OJF73016.1 PTS fructose transporter subunit IIA [Streptococcus bovimastitidis]
MVEQLVREDLLNLYLKANDKSHLLELLSDDLFEKGYVLDSFKEAIIKREGDFPTGLQLEEVAVAIPHTYSEHVKKPFLYINKLEETIPFIQMGTDDEIVQVSYVIVLGITEPHKQTGLLVELMEIFGDSEFLDQLQEAKSEEDLYHLFKK